MARAFIDYAGLRRRLQTLAARLPSGVAEKVISEMEAALGRRLLRDLDPKELEALKTRARTTIAKSAPTVKQLQKELLDAALKLHGIRVGSNLLVSAVDVRGGVWVFFHTDAATDALIVGEAFVARRPGGAIPKTRPSPEAAGLRGKPRWSDGARVQTDPPPVRAAAPVKSGLSEEALERGADAILDEMRRGEDAALAQATQPRPKREVVLRGPVPSKAALTQGTGIESISYRAPAAGGPPPGKRAWDTEVLIVGRTGPEIPRRPDTELDAVLPRAGELNDPRYKGLL
jgi:hypothetical protein